MQGARGGKCCPWGMLCWGQARCRAAVWGWGTDFGHTLVLSLMGGTEQTWHLGWEETFLWYFLAGAVFVSA